MKGFAAVLATFLLYGCGSPSRMVILQQPETKQTVECKVDPWGDMSYSSQVERCVLAYKQAGYKIVGDSHEPIDNSPVKQ